MGMVSISYIIDVLEWITMATKNVNYINLLINSSTALQKTLSIEVEQETGTWRPRPQMHVLICSSFGTGKSTNLAKLISENPKDFIKIDDFTPPALMGSIKKNGDFVKGILLKLGGKTMIADEFSEISEDSKNELLNLLENQNFRRTLGFSANRPYKENSKFCRYSIRDNTIEGYIKFTMIAATMHWPSMRNSQALLSRFNPIFTEPSIEEALDIGLGKRPIELHAQSRFIKKIFITKPAYIRYHDDLKKLVQKIDKLAKIKEPGFVLRVSSDIIRLAIADIIINSPEEIQKDELIIDKSELLTRHLAYFPIELFYMKCCSLNLTQLGFVSYKIKHPDLTDREMSEKLNVTPMQIWRVKEDLRKNGLLKLLDITLR
jgi:hypothetical protein